MLHRMPQLLIRLQTAVINAIRAHLGHLSREVFCVSSVADWRQGLVLSNDASPASYQRAANLSPPDDRHN